MYTGEEFEEATEKVARWLEDIREDDVTRLQFVDESEEDTGDESDDGSEEESNDDEPDNAKEGDKAEQSRLRLLIAEEPAGPDYRVFAEEGKRFFRIQTNYKLWENIADYIPDEQVEEFVSTEIVDDDHPLHSYVPDFDSLDDEDKRRTIAAFQIIENISREEEKELVTQLVRIATNNSLKHVIGSLGEGRGIPTFAFYHKIFPYEDDFDIDLLNRRVELVRMGSHMGEIYLRYAFNLPVDLVGNTGGEIGGPLESPLGITDGPTRMVEWNQE